MLETLLANIAQQFLKLGDAHNARAAEGLQRIIGNLAFADITANDPFAVARRETRETHRTRLHQPDAGPVGILLAHRAGDDLLKIHLHAAEEMLGKVAAVEADSLVRILAVIIVPIEQSAGSLRSKLQCMHAHDAAD